MPALVDLTGKQFGKLTVLNRAIRKGPVIWICKCECGNTHEVPGYNLRTGDTKSCGCYRIEASTKRATKHGNHRTRTYNIWAGMKNRCTNPRATDYAYYGGRGISICDEWNDFAKFHFDMGDCPRNFTIERIDNNGNYCKENCEWVSRRTQNRNTRNNVFITHNGITLCLADWADKTGIDARTLSARHNRGWSDSDVVTRPVRKIRK